MYKYKQSDSVHIHLKISTVRLFTAESKTHSLLNVSEGTQSFFHTCNTYTVTLFISNIQFVYTFNTHTVTLFTSNIQCVYTFNTHTVSLHM